MGGDEWVGRRGHLLYIGKAYYALGGKAVQILVSDSADDWYLVAW